MLLLDEPMAGMGHEASTASWSSSAPPPWTAPC